MSRIVARIAFAISVDIGEVFLDQQFFSADVALLQIRAMRRGRTCRYPGAVEHANCRRSSRCRKASMPSSSTCVRLLLGNVGKGEHRGTVDHASSSAGAGPLPRNCGLSAYAKLQIESPIRLMPAQSAEEAQCVGSGEVTPAILGEVVEFARN